VAFSNDGAYLATADVLPSWDRAVMGAAAPAAAVVRVWETGGGRPVAQFAYGSETVARLAFSPDNRHVITANKLPPSQRGVETFTTARVLDIDGQRETARLTHTADIAGLALSPDGRCVALAGEDGVLRIWRAADSHEVARVPAGGQAASLAFSPNGMRFAAAVLAGPPGGSAPAAVLVWDLAPFPAVPAVHESPVPAVAYSPVDARRLATASWDKSGRVWEVGTGRQIARVDHGAEAVAVAFSPDGQRVATASRDRTVRVWNAGDGQQVALLEHDREVGTVAFSPDGQRVATGSRDGTVRIWDIGTAREVTRGQHGGNVTAVAYSPSGQYLASAGGDFADKSRPISGDNTARVWEVTGDGLRQIAKVEHQDSVWGVAFHRDGRRLATASADQTVRILDARTGVEVARLPHEASVTSVSFSPDGALLATTSGAAARLWDLVTRTEVVLLSHREEVGATAFSPDGTAMATASSDGAVRVWPLRAQDLIDQACARLSRNLSRDEWRQYLADEPYRKTCPSLP
jgi:WD40 repeat protein